MILPSGYVFQELKPYEINREFSLIKSAFNGKVAIGAIDGKDRNWDGVMVNHTFAAANTEESITHDLLSIPVGYLTIRSSNGGVIYDGITRWTKNVIYLQSTTAANNVTIFILR